MNLKFFKPLLVLSLLICILITTYSQVKQFRYQQAVKSGNSYYESGDYINAKVAFQFALRIKANDEYATEMITLTLDLIKGQSDKRKDYSNLLVQADQDFSNLKLQLARAAYQQALNLFPFEKYPKKQIERIDLLILENKEIIKDNEEAIIEGDRFFEIKEYEDAKIEFQYALGLIPGQEYAKKRLRDLRRIMSGLSEANLEIKRSLKLSNSLLAQGDSISAKTVLQNLLQLEPTNSEAIALLSIINSKLSISDKIDEFIKNTEEYLLVGDLYNAERTYRDALMLSPENDVLRNRLTEIEQLISEKRTTPLEDYENAIREGNRLMLEGKTLNALKFFDFAARLRPTAQNPLLNTSDLVQKPLQDLLIEKKDLDYNTAINEALIQLEANNLTASISLLQLADSLKQITQFTESTLLQDSIQSVIDLRNQSVTAFDQYLAEAKNLINSNRLAEARLALENSQKIKDGFDLSQQQINLFNELSNSLAVHEQIAKLITQAYNYQIKGDFLASQAAYQEALKLDSNSTLIVQHLLEIQNLLDDEQARNIFLYNQALQQAENLLASGDFRTAALHLRTADSLNQQQILVSEKYSQINNLYQTQLKEARKRYEALIVNADYYYRAKEYDKALQAFVDAKELFPSEKYPLEMILRITKQFTSLSLRTISESTIKIKNGETHRINMDPIDISDRRDIYFYIQLKNISKIKNQKIIFNYGRNGQKNGGVIVRLVESDETTDYLVRVGNQYRWFNQDNNWISLQAEGGEVELLLCKITKAE